MKRQRLLRASRNDSLIIGKLHFFFSLYISCRFFFAAKLNARCDCCIDTNWMKNTHTSKLLFIILIMMLTHSTRCEAVVCFSMHFKWNLAAHDYSSFSAALVELQFIRHDNKSLNNCPRKNSLFCALQTINLMRWRDTTWSLLQICCVSFQ